MSPPAMRVDWDPGSGGVRTRKGTRRSVSLSPDLELTWMSRERPAGKVPVTRRRTLTPSSVRPPATDCHWGRYPTPLGTPRTQPTFARRNENPFGEVVAGSSTRVTRESPQLSGTENLKKASFPLRRESGPVDSGKGRPSTLSPFCIGVRRFGVVGPGSSPEERPGRAITRASSEASTVPAAPTSLPEIDLPLTFNTNRDRHRPGERQGGPLPAGQSLCQSRLARASPGPSAAGPSPFEGPNYEENMYPILGLAGNKWLSRVVEQRRDNRSCLLRLKNTAPPRGIPPRV